MACSSDSKIKGNDIAIKDPTEIAAMAPGQSLQDVELIALNEIISEPVESRSRLRIIAIMTALYLAMFIVALDQTIVATSIPTIAYDLKSASGYVWIGGAYLLSNAASGPIWAKLSDIFGRRPVFLVADALFFAASIFCAKAGSMRVLIIGRTFQGVACGGLIPLIMITISDLYSVRSRSLYVGIGELVWVVAGGVGPVLGGLFTQKLSWRWNFWINLPISGTTFILLLIYLDVHNPKTPLLDGLKAIDWFGSLSIIALVLMLLLGLEFGGATVPWNSPRVICLIVFGSLMSIVFIYSEKRLARYPLMPLELFANWSNAASLLLTLWHGLIYIGGEYYLPLFFQSVKGSPPLTSGLLIMPVTISAAITGILAGVLIHLTGRYLEITYIGVAFMSIGNGLYILLSPTSTVAAIIVYQIVAGIGAGLLFQAPLIALQARVSQNDTATAIATFGFVRNIATALSVVIGGVIFQNSMDIRIPPLALPPINLPSNVTDLLTKGGAAANVMLSNTISDIGQRGAVREAYAWSMRNMWIFYTAVSSLAVISCAFIKRHHLRSDHVETRTGIKNVVGGG